MNFSSLIRQFAKAQVSAVIATFVDFSLTALLFMLWTDNPALCTFIGAFCGGVVNFLLNYRWTFDVSSASVRRVIIRYSLIWLGSVAINTYGTTALYWAMVHYLAFPTTALTLTIAKMVVAVAVAIFWNFLLQKYFVFRPSKPAAHDDCDADADDSPAI